MDSRAKHGVRRVFVDEEDTAYLHDLEVIHVQPISGRIALDLVSEDFENRSLSTLLKGVAGVLVAMCKMLSARIWTGLGFPVDPEV
jgi:hypothetical protein